MDNQPQQPKIIKFADIKQDLLAELNKRISEGKLKIPEKVDIVDGFLNNLITMELSGAFVLGGPSIPTIMLVGQSGQIYFFALRALLPKIFE